MFGQWHAKNFSSAPAEKHWQHKLVFTANWLEISCHEWWNALGNRNESLFLDVKYGSPARARTSDMVINSHPLYQLSYGGVKNGSIVSCSKEAGYWDPWTSGTNETGIASYDVYCPLGWRSSTCNV